MFCAIGKHLGILYFFLQSFFKPIRAVANTALFLLPISAFYHSLPIIIRSVYLLFLFSDSWDLHFRLKILFVDVWLQRIGLEVVTLGLFTTHVLTLHFFSKQIHLVSNLLLNLLQCLSINELRKRIQSLLVKQSHKVVAKPPHLSLPMIQWIFQYPVSITILNSSSHPCSYPHTLAPSSWLLVLTNPHLLSWSLSKGTLTNHLLKKHYHKCASRLTKCLFNSPLHIITITSAHRILAYIFRTLCEEYRHFITLDHYVGKEKL